MPVDFGTSYTHVQAVAASTWEIVHNLGHHPSVQVSIVDNGATRVILPKDVIQVDNGHVQVVFSSPRTGTARLI